MSSYSAQPLEVISLKLKNSLLEALGLMLVAVELMIQHFK
jgi:hypothetical protein